MTLLELVDTLPKCDILVLEGAYEATFTRAHRSLKSMVVPLAKKATHIITLGSCASFGGMMKEANPDAISGMLFDHEEMTGPLAPYRDKVIALGGCPVHPQWLSFTLMMLHARREIVLDAWHRPQALYGYTVHNGCLRNDYFEWKVDARTWGTKEGCLYYEQGCQGVHTMGSCNKTLWNGVSSKTRAGAPCIGCTEPSFPKRDLFHTKTYMSIPAVMPLGVPKRSYLALAGAAKSFHIRRLEERLIDDNA